MSNKDYLDPRWQKKRLEILERDGFKCTECMDETKTLHVHHTHYENHLDYWDYSNDSYITLCEDCHSYVHKKIRSMTPMKIQRLSDLVFKFYDFSCEHRFYMKDYNFYKDLVFEYITSDEGSLYFNLHNDEMETDHLINNFNIIQALLFYKVRRRNVKKLVDAWIQMDEICPPKEIAIEFLKISRDLGRSVFGD